MQQAIRFPVAAAIAALFALSAAQAQTMTSAEMGAAKDRIAADYKSARATCDAMAGNAKDICVEEAKGKEKVAKAELDYKRSGKAEDMSKVAMAKAEAEYEVAKERCDDKTGNDKDACRSQAKAAEAKAKADAKASMGKS